MTSAHREDQAKRDQPRAPLVNKEIYLGHSSGTGPAHTDSGYAAEGFPPRTTLLGGEKDLCYSSAAGPAHTDSGYASGGHQQRKFLEDDSQKPPQLGEMTTSDTPGPQTWESGEYDAMTIYGRSDTSSLPQTAHEKYISDLALDIVHVLKEFWSDSKTLERICDELPDLLSGFALKMGCEAQTQMERDISYFVQKNRLCVSRVRYHTNLSIYLVLYDMPSNSSCLLRIQSPQSQLFQERHH
jgi:hypothetical protein